MRNLPLPTVRPGALRSSVCTAARSLPAPLARIALSGQRGTATTQPRKYLEAITQITSRRMPLEFNSPASAQPRLFVVADRPLGPAIGQTAHRCAQRFQTVRATHHHRATHRRLATPLNTARPGHQLDAAGLPKKANLRYPRIESGDAPIGPAVSSQKSQSAPFQFAVDSHTWHLHPCLSQLHVPCPRPPRSPRVVAPSTGHNRTAALRIPHAASSHVAAFAHPRPPGR